MDRGPATHERTHESTRESHVVVVVCAATGPRGPQPKVVLLCPKRLLSSPPPPRHPPKRASRPQDGFKRLFKPSISIGQNPNPHGRTWPSFLFDGVSRRPRFIIRPGPATPARSKPPSWGWAAPLPLLTLPFLPPTRPQIAHRGHAWWEDAWRTTPYRSWRAAERLLLRGRGPRGVPARKGARESTCACVFAPTPKRSRGARRRGELSQVLVDDGGTRSPSSAHTSTKSFQSQRACACAAGGWSFA